jgi:hypothetical protein
MVHLANLPPDPAPSPRVRLPVSRPLEAVFPPGRVLSGWRRPFLPPVPVDKAEERKSPAREAPVARAPALLAPAVVAALAQTQRPRGGNVAARRATTAYRRHDAEPPRSPIASQLVRTAI